MNSITRITLALSCLATGFFALTLSACGDPSEAGCRVDSDCRSGRICQARECVDRPVGDIDAGATDGGTANVNPNGEPNVQPNGDPNAVTPDMGMGGTDAGDPGMDAGDPGMDAGTPDMDPEPVFGPQMSVTPERINFGFVPTGTTIDAVVRVSNQGDEVLVLSSVALESNPSQGFAVNSPTMMVDPGQTIDVTVSFAPTQNAEFGNAVVIEGNDADNPSFTIPIVGRGFDATFQSCMFSTPQNIDFGPVPVGQSATATVTVGNCSRGQDVRFTAASILRNTPEFTVTSNAPITLMPGDTETVTVTFTPTDLARTGDALRVESNANIGDVNDIRLLGGGGCAESVALADIDALANDLPRTEPLAAVAGATINLDGTSSRTPSGVVSYSWSVVSAPAASSATIVGPTDAQTSFTPDVAGDYVVELNVSDPNSGAPSCGAAQLEITALADLPEVLVELEWAADHDLDLHVLRDDGNGNFPRFNDPDDDLHFGALWLDWGVTNDRTDDGYHLGDDRDGDGPETAAIAKLEAGRTYRVVAHFESADGFQPTVFNTTLSINRRSMGPGSGQVSETRVFNIAERGLYWVAFEIDGSTGRINFINRATQ